MVAQTLPFGELALLEDLVTREQLLPLLQRQAELRDADRPTRKIGTLLVHEGFISKSEAKRLLRLQRDSGPIEGYELLERIGSGGMGTVYRATQKSLDREVALKILARKASKHERYRARFLQEAKLLAQLRHANLVKVYDIGESNGHLYFAMEYVRGKTARDLIRRFGTIPEPEALDYMEQVTRAICHYNEHKIIHRDIKPENILIDDKGVAKIADLGLSKQNSESGDLHLTRPGKTLGTPLYISPELARGDDNIDVRSDLYSLGATVYHLVCGAPPFERDSSADLLTAHVRDTPRTPREVNPVVSEVMEELLLNLLEKKPRNRVAGPEALLEAIARVRKGESPFPKSARKKDAPRTERRGSTSGARERTPTTRTPAAGRRPGSGSGADRERAPRSAPQARNGVLVAGVVFVIAIVGVIAATAFTPAPAKAAVVPTDPIEQLAQLAKKDADEALIQVAAWESSHGLEPDGAIVRYEAIARGLPAGSPAASRVEARLSRARQNLEEVATAAFEDLRAGAFALVDQGKTEQALARVAAFPARFEKTAAWAQREELRREIQQLGTKK